MSNITIENIDKRPVALENCVYEDDTLTLSGAQSLFDGTILARDSVSNKLVPYVPGGQVTKATSDGPFALNAGDTVIVDVDNIGAATATFDAAAATITDTTTYPVADQDGLAFTITLSGGPFDGVAQTVTFSGATTTAASVASQANAQLQGCSVSLDGGQVKITSDVLGTDADIAFGAGTSGLTFAASVPGTGDVGNIKAVTATEFKTVVEADTSATVDVVGDAAVIGATEELDFTGGTGLAKFGLSVETLTANNNGVAKAVLRKGFDGINGDNAIRALIKGRVLKEKLSIVDGSSVGVLEMDQLRNYSIIVTSSTELNEYDNQ